MSESEKREMIELQSSAQRNESPIQPDSQFLEHPRYAGELETNFKETPPSEQSHTQQPVSETLQQTPGDLSEISEAAPGTNISPESLALNEKVRNLKMKYERLLQRKNQDFSKREYNIYQRFSTPQKGNAEESVFSSSSDVEVVIKDLSEVSDTVSSIRDDLSETAKKMQTILSTGNQSSNLAVEACPLRLKEITDRVPKALQKAHSASRALRYSAVIFHNKKQHALHCCKRMMGICLTLQKEFGRFLVTMPPADTSDLKDLKFHLNLSLDALNVILCALDDGMIKFCALKIAATGRPAEDEQSIMNASADLNQQPANERIFIHPSLNRINSMYDRIDRMNTTTLSIVCLVCVAAVTIIFGIVLIEKELELRQLKRALNSTL